MEWNHSQQRTEQGNIQGLLTRFDRTGKVLGTIGDPGCTGPSAISPDGKRVAFERADPQVLPHYEPGFRFRASRDHAVHVLTGLGRQSRLVAGRSHIASGGEQPDIGILPSTKRLPTSLVKKSCYSSREFTKFPAAGLPTGMFSFRFQSGWHHPRVWGFSIGWNHRDSKAFPLEQSDFAQAAGRFFSTVAWIAYQSNEWARTSILRAAVRRLPVRLRHLPRRQARLPPANGFIQGRRQRRLSGGRRQGDVLPGVERNGYGC